MPFSNRGFKRTNTGQRGATISPGRAGGTSNRVPGAPVIPRAKSGPSTASDLYQNPPASWFGPVGEWAIWYDLTIVRKFVQWVDFQYQPAISAPGLNKKGFNRADFLILPNGKGGGGAALAPRGIVINPISDFTHPSRALDILERNILGNNGYLEVFIDARDLQTRAHVVVGLALQGVDVSSRGSGRFR